jgi:hypothetical protein
MGWYPPQDGANPAQDRDGTTHDAEVIYLGPFFVPDDFVGTVKARVSARVVQTNPSAETSYLATIVNDVRKQGVGACQTIGVGSRHVSGDDNFAGGDYLLSAVLQPSTHAEWPGAMELKLTGRLSTTVYWDTRVRVEGRIITGDG